jgi:hypothetical protein
MKNDWNQGFAFIGAVLSLGFALHGNEKCPAEVKLLLSPPTIETVIASLGFGKETAGRVYFFDPPLGKSPRLMNLAIPPSTVFRKLAQRRT